LPEATGRHGTRRIEFLDAIRGLAASIVVVQHAVETQSPRFKEWSYEYVNLGRVGVVAFFLVSGYVIPLSLENQDLRTFVVRRFFRLYPVYWLTIVAFLVVAAGSPEEPAISGGSLIMNVLMLQGLVGGALILSPSWTLGIELFFYAQEVVATRVSRLGSSVRLGWFWLLVLLSFGLWGALRGVRPPLALPLLLYTASLGHSLHLRDARGGRDWVPLILAGLLVVPLASFLGVHPAPDDWRPSGYALSYFVGVALFLVLYALRSRSSARALLSLGTISYAVYLVHPAVAVVLLRLRHVQDWWLVLANLTGVLLVAAAVHRYVERPSIDLGRRLTRAPVSAPGSLNARGAEGLNG